MEPTSEPARAEPTSRVLTLPNVISGLRIALIPVYVALVVDRDMTISGVLLFAFVVATDWVDGAIARRTGQVSRVGTLLDPIADRLAIAAGLVAFSWRGLFPWWAAAAILVRDAVVLLVGAVALVRRGVRLEVRWIGKIATFSLMVAITSIAWARLDLFAAEAALVVGWIAFAIGIAEYYAAALVYARDLLRALATAR